MILIVGAGITGLTLAYELQKRGVEYTLAESSPSPGGYIKSLSVEDYLLELGPNTILADEQVKTFLYELGLNDQMLIPTEQVKNRYVLKKGSLKKLPSGPLSFLFGNFFSWETKRAIFRERNLKSQAKENETIGEFFERRFNKELVDYAIDPFVSGIFAGNPYELLIGKTMPFVPRMEQEYGSVVRGFMKSKTSPKKESVVFKDGMEKLAAAIADTLTHIRYTTKVKTICKSGESWQINLLCKGMKSVIHADRIVFTTPSFITAGILQDVAPAFSEQLNGINYCPMVKVFLGYKKSDIEFYPSGYGVLNPSCEKQFTLGTIWNSSINPYASPESHSLFTVMIGGASGKDKVNLTDDELKKKVHEELKNIYKIKSAPDFTYVFRIPKAIPQYDRNILGVDQVAEMLQENGIYIAANWHKGAALSDCIKKAMSLSEKILQDAGELVSAK